MDPRFLIGVDIGTSGSKGVLVDTQGKVRGFKFVEHVTESPRPGWYEHDAEHAWWGDLGVITRALIQQSGVDPVAIAAIAVSGLAPEMLPLDKDGRPLRKAIIYCDSRAQRQSDEMVAALTALGVPDTITRSVSALAIGPKIVWFREHEPALFARTWQIHTCSSYLVYRLTGQSVVDYATAASTFPLFDFGRGDWDSRICAQAGIPIEKLPRVACRWATDIAGTVTPEAAAHTGLAEGTLVTAGATDGFCDFLSTGAVRVGEASLSYGTTMLSTIVVGEAIGRQMGRLAPVPGMSTTGLATSASGALTTWFRSNFGQAELDAEQKLGLNSYQLLSLEAVDIPPGSEGLVVLPYFAGERAPIHDPSARGLIIGLTLSHSRRHLYRALIEGIAYSVRHNYDLLEEKGAAIQRIVATGGGTRNQLWLQAVSDVTGKDQDVVKNPIGAPYGDAFLAGYGAGFFHDLTPLQEEWAPATVRVTSNPDAKRIYDRYYAVYRDLYQQNRESMHRLVELAAERPVS